MRVAINHDGLDVPRALHIVWGPEHRIMILNSYMIPVNVVPRVSAGRLVIGIWIGQSWPQQETILLLSQGSAW